MLKNIVRLQTKMKILRAALLNFFKANAKKVEKQQKTNSAMKYFVHLNVIYWCGVYD